MKRVARSLRILWRAESQIGAVRTSSLLKKTSLLALAAVVGLFGVAMLDIASFFALAPKWGNTVAALIVALGDFILAIVLIVSANAMKPGVELEMLGEVRDMALEDLEAEFASLETSVLNARNELLDKFRHPMSSLAPSVLVPLLKSVISGLRHQPEHQ